MSVPRTGVPPSQDRTGIPPLRGQDWGIPLTGTRVPPPEGQDRVPLSQDRTGVPTHPPSQDRTGAHLWLGLGTPPPPPSQDWRVPPPLRQNSRASTCYAAGGMPLAVTQEDYLVRSKVSSHTSGQRFINLYFFMACRETASIQFRLPDGTRITNRFQSSDTLGDARAYLLEVCSVSHLAKTSDNLILNMSVYF